MRDATCDQNEPMRRWSVLLMIVTACSGAGAGGSTTSEVANDTSSSITMSSRIVIDDLGGFPAASSSGHPSGNRYVTGFLDLAAEPIRIELTSVPLWVAALDDSEGLVVAVVTDNDQLSMMRIEEQGVVGLSTEAWDNRMPPVLVRKADEATLLRPPPNASPFSAPNLVDSQPVWILTDGSLSGLDTSIESPLLADGRIAVGGNAQVAVLSDPTDRYAHGVLGDELEAGSVTIVDDGGAVTVPAPEGTVFEAVAPLWADVDDDGEDELLVTASNGSEGARLIAFEASGEVAATSDPVGRGFRWLNQLAVAPTGPNDETEIIEVRTPHIGGIVRWYRLIDGKLELQATATEYSTHRIGSRNVDQGIAVDLTRDGRPDVLVPNQEQDRLVGLTRTPDGAEQVLSIGLPDRLTTNLAAVSYADGTTSLVVGTADASLLIWGSR